MGSNFCCMMPYLVEFSAEMQITIDTWTHTCNERQIECIRFGWIRFEQVAAKISASTGCPMFNIYGLFDHTSKWDVIFEFLFVLCAPFSNELCSEGKRTILFDWYSVHVYASIGMPAFTDLLLHLRIGNALHFNRIVLFYSGRRYARSSFPHNVPCNKLQYAMWMTPNWSETTAVRSNWALSICVTEKSNQIHTTWIWTAFVERTNTSIW